MFHMLGNIFHDHYRTPFSPKVEILLWTVQIYYKRSRFYHDGQDMLWKFKILLWTVKIFTMTGRDFVMNGGDFLDDRSRFYYEQLRFSWWQVEIFMRKGRDILWWQVEISMVVGLDFLMNSWDYHDDRSKFYNERQQFSRGLNSLAST